MKTMVIVISGEIRTLKICYASLKKFIDEMKQDYYVHVITTITYTNTISYEKSPSDHKFFQKMYDDVYINKNETYKLLKNIGDSYCELHDEYDYGDVFQLQILRKYNVMQYINTYVSNLDCVLFTRTDAYYFDTQTLHDIINNNKGYFHFADALYCFDKHIIYNKDIFNDIIYNNLKNYDWFCNKVVDFYTIVDKTQIESKHYAAHYIMNYFIDGQKRTLDYTGVVIMCNNTYQINKIYDDYVSVVVLSE